MVAAIKQIVTVQAGGRIEIRSSQLEAGTQAEVIVLVDETQLEPASQRVEVLDALQKSMQLDVKSAKKWVANAKAERGVAFGDEA